ncbi:MAG: FimB/Mfa2 family fimbrial subunit [Prevotella sp.]|nr:FimB/Mfa2 family fimbrial subunit [Prevotella sp.]
MKTLLDIHQIMKRSNILHNGLAVLALALTASACSMMSEDRSDCPDCRNPLRVTLKYDYNIQRADMFNDHVGAAVCYVVDESDKIVAKQYAANSAEARPLAQRTFGFNFEGLAAGNYRIFAVGAQKDFGTLTNFTPTDLDEGSSIRDLRLAIDHAATDQPLDTLWHGAVGNIQLQERQPAEAEVSLMRDTKNLSIMLVQNTNPTDNYAENYDVSITDNNGLLDYDNSQLADPELTYTPYASWTSETVEEESSRAPGDVIQRTAHFDLSFGRLFEHADASKNARLVIRNHQTGDKIVDIDLVYYLALVRNAAENRYGVQEFLDRAYDYRLDFILEGNEWRFLTLSINVIGWSLRIQNASI